MFWLKDDITEKISKKTEQISNLVKRSFLNVKRDTTTIFHWLNYLYKKDLEKDNIIRHIRMQLSSIPKTNEEIRRIIEQYYSHEHLISRINELGHSVEELSRKQSFVEHRPLHTEQIHQQSTQMQEISHRLARLEQKRISMREKIVTRITRNSGEYLKGIILSYIRKYRKISALKLKEMIVDEQALCSKSSFYRLLGDIEQLDEISVIKQGKEKHFLHKITRSQ